MTNDFENSINLDQLEDDEISDLIRERLDEDADFDVDSVDVEVLGGRVTVEGRVGTEGERQHVEQVLSALGATDFDNNVVVDANARAQRAEGADDARLEDASSSLGGNGDSTSDTAEHLQPDDDSEMNGTRDMQKAIEEGKSYNPPDGPTQMGIGGGEQH